MLQIAIDNQNTVRVTVNAFKGNLPAGSFPVSITWVNLLLKRTAAFCFHAKFQQGVQIPFYWAVLLIKPFERNPRRYQSGRFLFLLPDFLCKTGL